MSELITRMEIGIAVRDIEASTPFYRDGLGLPHIVDQEPMGPRGVQRRFAYGDQVVKIMTLKDPPDKVNPPGGLDGGSIGLRYVTLFVDDLEEVVARCVKLGAKVPWPVQEFAPGKKVAVVEDAEGNCFELCPNRRAD